MTTATQPMDEWNLLPWHKLEKQVFKLQTRIYRASQRGDVRTVRRLQRLLTRSWAAKCLAVRRVTQDNQGKKTAGVDGVHSLTPVQRLFLVRHLTITTTAQPVRRIFIPKPSQPGEKRPLGIPTLTDRARQALVKLALEPEWEAKFEPNSYGFRPGRSCHDAIGQIFLSIHYKPKYVLDADIAQCFDKINHAKLLDKINTSPTFRRQIRAWLGSGVIDGSLFYQSEAGTPQGGVISPLLANIALHGMEYHLQDAFPKKRNAPTLIRYCDDFVILHESLAVIEQCQQLIQSWLHDMGLELKPSKTQISHTLTPYQGKVGFDFLGFTIRQFPVGQHTSGKLPNGKLLGFKTIISPSQAKLKQHATDMGRIIRQLQGVSQIALIARLKPIIIGWCNYFRSSVCRRAFSQLDHILFQQLKAWSQRRHPNASIRWRKSKYWRRLSSNQFRFAALFHAQEFVLPLHSDTQVLRHVKVQSHRSPFDADWIYWSSRLGRFPGISRTEAFLLKKQKGKCPYCNLFFKFGDLLEIDHVLPRSTGGSNSIHNQQLLHRHCHVRKTALDKQIEQIRKTLNSDHPW